MVPVSELIVENNNNNKMLWESTACKFSLSLMGVVLFSPIVNALFFVCLSPHSMDHHHMSWRGPMLLDVKPTRHHDAL